MISRDAPFRKLRDEYARSFPILSNSLLIVVDGQTPQLAREAAERLGEALAAQPERFQDVYIPGSDPFFERSVLLYRSVDELDEFADELSRLQPLIAALETDPSVARLSGILRQGLSQLTAGQDAAASERWASMLDHISRASTAVYEEHPVHLSWDEILLQGSAVELDARRVIRVEPVLETDSLLPAGPALHAIDAAAEALELDAEHGVRVRVTGNPALSYEEMVGLAWDIGGAGVFCFALVCGVLYAALRSLQLVAAAVATLLVGLVWTAAFAAAAVGHLNMVSIAFGVLFIGLGVDFAIHLGMQYARRRDAGLPHPRRCASRWKRSGPRWRSAPSPQPSASTSSFRPTPGRGRAGSDRRDEHADHPAADPDALPRAALVLAPDTGGRRDRREHALRRALGRGIVAAPARRAGRRARPGRRRPRTGAQGEVRAQRRRDEGSGQRVRAGLQRATRGAGRSSPWYVNVVSPTAREAERLLPALRALPSVSRVVTLADYVPRDQEEKLEILADLAMLFDTPAAVSRSGSQTAVDEQIASLAELRDYLTLSLGREPATATPLARSVARLRGELDDLVASLESDGDPKAAVARFERILLSTLPGQIAKLKTALDPGEVTFDQLPPRLVARMRSAGGRERTQVFPAADLQQDGALEEFVTAVSEVAPGAVGMAVDVVEFSRVTVQSLEEALASALAVISLLLLALWRRIGDTVLVMLPLLLAGVLTVATVTVCGLSFNFANVIVLPLLLGIGVDSGIHLVHRARSAGARGADLLSETTARAVFYSALTTIASFGSLALSSHRGVASLGSLLVIGIAFTLVANLIVLPALLAVAPAGEKASSGGDGALPSRRARSLHER